MPPKLAEVVTPGSLASFLAPSAWEPLRSMQAKLDELKAEHAKILAKTQEVEDAIHSQGARRVRNVAAMAAMVLDGKTPPREPEPEREGLAALGVDELRDLKIGLQQKALEVKGDIEWYTGRARTAARDLVRQAATAAADKYAGLVRGEVAELHRELSAAQGLLAGDRDSIVPMPVWDSERFLAPRVVDDRLTNRETPYSDPCLVIFQGAAGAGVDGPAQSWRQAVKAATGFDFV